MVLWWPKRPSRTNTKKWCLFTIGGWNAKVESQEISKVTGKFGKVAQNEAGQRLIESCKEDALVIPNPLLTTQETTVCMDITRQSILKLDWLYSLQPKTRNSIQSAKARPGADCGSDHELLVTKFRLKVKKVGKPVDHLGMTQVKSLTIMQWKWQIDSRD